MAKSKKPQISNNNTVDAVIEDTEAYGNKTAIFNMQNNFHLTQNIDIEKLTQLSEKNLELANKVFDLYSKQQQHNINIDNRILAIEEQEQKIRTEEMPFFRKFAFKTLNFAMLLSIISLFVAGWFAYLGHVKLAGISIIIPITVTVANMLNRNDKKNKQKK